MNFVDPSGRFAISALIIGAIVGAAVGFGTVAYIDYKDDGETFNGSIGWQDYVGTTVLGSVLGALGGSFWRATISFTIPTGLSLVQTGLGTTAIMVSTATVPVAVSDIILTAGALGITLMFARTNKSNGYYGEAWPGGPHKPSHVHLRGNNTDIRIGKNGKPLEGEPALNAQQKKALIKLWREFLKLFNKFY